MNTPSKSSKGSSWGLIIVVPICFLLIIYFLVSGRSSPEKQMTVEVLKPAWYTPETAGGEELVNQLMG